MSKTLTILEYGPINQEDISKSAWDELCRVANNKDKNKRYVKWHNATTLKAQNFIGAITTKDGTQIEILPKIYDEKDLEISRKTLVKMLTAVHKLDALITKKANLQLFKKLLSEVLIKLFLDCVEKIVKKGLRHHYQRKIAIAPFLKGQLQIHKQLNQPPHKQHLFHIKYSVFNANRAENRLLHSGLSRVSKISKDWQNQQKARHLLPLFDNIPLSNNYDNDFKVWSKSRNMAYYQPVLPWLSYILNQHAPYAIKGNHLGISFLLPMESLFEKYVAICLRKVLPSGFVLEEQSQEKYLATYNNRDVFKMRPDIVIYKDKKAIIILDTKWKRIDQNKSNYDISPSDIYQLYTYGKQYNTSQVGLIYPQWAEFSQLANYQTKDSLSILVIPFDLQNN